MKLSSLTRHAGVLALATTALASAGASTASASPAPNNGVRHEIMANTLWENGQVARQMTTELWVDSDSAAYSVKVDDDPLTWGYGNATDSYLYDPTANHVIHFHNPADNEKDQADPATYGVDKLPSSGTTTVNGITVEERDAQQPTGPAPLPPGASAIMGKYYINPATGRIVRIDYTAQGQTVERTDFTTDEVLPDTSANHALAAVQSHPSASVEEFQDAPANGSAAAKKRARAHAKKKSAKKSVKRTKKSIKRSKSHRRA